MLDYYFDGIYLVKKTIFDGIFKQLYLDSFWCIFKIWNEEKNNFSHFLFHFK